MQEPAALRDFGPAYDCCGSIASDRYARDARPMSATAPIATELWRRNKTSLSANSRHMHRSKPRSLFDHLVGARQQRRRNGEVKHPGGLGIDHQLELARLHDRQVGGLGALEDTAGVNSELPKRIDNVGSVAHQPTDFSKIAVGKCRGDRVARCQIDQLGTPTV